MIMFLAHAGTSSPGVFSASYNLTAIGNYSLAVTELLSGQTVIGSPFTLIVAANKAFGPTTQVRAN